MLHRAMIRPRCRSSTSSEQDGETRSPADESQALAQPRLRAARSRGCRVDQQRRGEVLEPVPLDEKDDDGFARRPNLVVIDGGKGQLSAALAAMQAYDLRASR